MSDKFLDRITWLLFLVAIALIVLLACSSCRSAKQSVDMKAEYADSISSRHEKLISAGDFTIHSDYSVDLSADSIRLSYLQRDSIRQVGQTGSDSHVNIDMSGMLATIYGLRVSSALSSVDSSNVFSQSESSSMMAGSKSKEDYKSSKISEPKSDNKAMIVTIVFLILLIVALGFLMRYLDYKK